MDESICIINEGTDTEPNFLAETFAQANGSDLIVPPNYLESGRSSPEVLDLDHDGKQDILTGNTEGQLLFYRNTGSVAEPNFPEYQFVEADGIAIDLPSQPRSRPIVCDWTGDGCLDVLVGAGTGNVHLFEGVVFAGDLEPDGDVDLSDFATFAMWWLDSDCGSKDDCGGADILGDGDVLLDDFATLATNWLAGT